MYTEPLPYSQDNDYLIYPDGQVWSAKSNKFLAQSMRGMYYTVGMFINGKQARKTVHRLVAETFVSNPQNLPQVNHIDENKLNNHYSNLEWVTVKENANHGTRNQKISEKNKQLFPHGAGKRGEHPNAKKVWMCDAKTHEKIRLFDSTMSACDYLGKLNAQSNISAVCRGKRKTCLGYYWQYDREGV